MMQQLENLALSLVQGPFAYVWLFLVGAIASTLIPLSPEVVAIAVWKGGMPVVASIAVLTAGNYAGNVLNYWVGRLGEHWVLEKYFRVKKARLDRAQRWFDRFGPPILLFSWLPVVGDPLTFVPGIVRYSFFKFSAYVLIGKIIRYVGLYALVRGFV
ncbi:MAG: YqaA family protein [Patescibacteria group bacterium]|nr:YqaA family protein [bacterium]MDZ4221781.1 YqaA family protein [Patescibacteria group bacterium]